MVGQEQQQCTMNKTSSSYFTFTCIIVIVYNFCWTTEKLQKGTMPRKQVDPEFFWSFSLVERHIFFSVVSCKTLYADVIQS